MNFLQHKSGRHFVAFAFYFAEGVPIGFIWWAMPTLLRQHHFGLDTIGFFTSTLTLPWVFKFLWAPLVDLFRPARLGFTGWIAGSQMLMCASLVPLLFLPLEGNFYAWWLLLLIHSCCAATQDVSVDAMVIQVVAQKEQGILNGYMQAGMLTGRSLFGGGALILISKYGTEATIGCMIFAILCTMALLPWIRSAQQVREQPASWSMFRQRLQGVFRQPHTGYLIAFALTGAAAFEATGALAGPYLTDRHMDSEMIGFFFGIPVVVAMLSGGLAGGYLSDRMSRTRSVTFFLLGVVLCVAALAAAGMAVSQVNPYLIMGLLTAMYFFTGMFTSASYALFMNFTNPKLGGTQFSSYMAATNGCEAWAVWIAGILAATHGYPLAFLVMCGVSLLSLLFLRKTGIAPYRDSQGVPDS